MPGLLDRTPRPTPVGGAPTGAPRAGLPRAPAPGAAAPEQQVQAMVPKVGVGPGQPGRPGAKMGPVQRPAPEVTTEPVTRDREGKPIAGVSGRLQGLLSEESPYIQRARARAKQAANRRGLMNTSIAAGAGEAAAIDAALPIAQADAGIAASERGLRSAEFMQARDHKVQQLMQQRGFDHDSAQRQADRELSELLQQRDINARRMMLSQQLSAQAALAAANRQLQRDMQSAGFEFAAEQGELNREFTTEQSALERGQRQQIAIDNARRQIEGTYQAAMLALSLNTDLPPEERARMQDHIAFVRDQQFTALGNTYDFTPEWTSTRRPGEG